MCCSPVTTASWFEIADLSWQAKIEKQKSAVLSNEQVRLRDDLK